MKKIHTLFFTVSLFFIPKTFCLYELIKKNNNEILNIDIEINSEKFYIDTEIPKDQIRYIRQSWFGNYSVTLISTLEKDILYFFDKNFTKDISNYQTKQDIVNLHVKKFIVPSEYVFLKVEPSQNKPDTFNITRGTYRIEPNEFFTETIQINMQENSNKKKRRKTR